MSRRERSGWWLGAVVAVLSGCGGDAGWSPWMLLDGGVSGDGAVVATDAPALDSGDASDAGARDADGGDASDGGDGDAISIDVTLTFDGDVGASDDVVVAQDVGFDAGVTPADVGIAMDRVVEVPVDTGVDVPVDRGQPIDTGVDVPVDRGQPIDTGVDVPIDRGQPIDTGVDVPIDRGQPIDTGVDVPIDRGQPIDTGVDVPIDRGQPIDTGVDVPVDRGNPIDTGVDVPIDRGQPIDIGVDVPVDRGPVDAGVDVPSRCVRTVADPGAPPPDPVSYTSSLTTRTGLFTASIRVQGVARSIRFMVPTSAGTDAPLLIVFHGTRGDGPGVMSESNAVALANSAGVIVAAPTALDNNDGVGDWDHPRDSYGTWWNTTNANTDSNPDLLLVRALMVEAQCLYGVDPARIYVMGHSNGAFFAQYVAVLLRDRIAAFSENSGGLVRCARTTGCSFQGSGSTCAALNPSCACSGPELAIPVPTSGRMPPGFLTHGTRDPLVTVAYTCALADAMTTRGHTQVTQLFNGEGHAIPPNWAQLVWPFLSTRRLY